MIRHFEDSRGCALSPLNLHECLVQLKVREKSPTEFFGYSLKECGKVGTMEKVSVGTEGT